ncbi:MAG TPA: BadF/BadG/BcrA/BcrD ATPase family protein [Actinoallomurus sp.]|jgi:N-acetylglucosamine kinase-like BadF-type ATPase
MAGPLYLGVDAGNSKTAALVCDASGAVVGAGRSGCGDIYGAPTPEEAVSAVLAAVDAALAQAGADRADVAGAAFRLAGIDWPEDHAYWEEALALRYPSLRRYSILNDGYAPIRCGEPSGVGVAVAAGTAAAIAARGPTGTLWDMSWWGQHPMGAIGLANEAIKAVLLAELGLGPETALTGALLEFYGRPTAEALNHWFTRREGGGTYRDRTRSARVVTATASAGDAVAASIVRAQGRYLATYAGLAARRTGLIAGSGFGERPVGVVLSGSVLMAEDSPVAAAFLAELPEHVPGAVAHRAGLAPVAGAALDALGESDVALSETVLDRLTRTVPPKAFLET